MNRSTNKQGNKSEFQQFSQTRSKHGGTSEAHTCSAAPAAEAEQQSSSDPALPLARFPLPQ